MFLIVQILKRHKNFLIFLFLSSFLIRALLFSLYLSRDKNYWNYDSPVYHNTAIQIVDGKGIVNLEGKTEFYRVPGYSLFLSACYKMFGTDIKMALWIQVFIASFIPIFVFLLSLILFPENFLLAKASSIISAFHLGYVLFSGLEMTESFFIFFLSIFFILFFSHIYFWAGIFLGIASLIRPVGHYLILVSIFLLIISKFDFVKKVILRPGGFRSQVKKSFILFLGWFLIVFWWLLRNWLFTGYLFFHTLPGIHFFKHSAARLRSSLDNCSYSLALDNITKDANKLQNKKEIEFGRKLNEIEHCKLLEKISVDYFKVDPLLTLRHCLLNMFKTCFSLYSAELLFITSGGQLPEYNNKRGWSDLFARFLFPQTTNLFLKIIIYLEIIFLFFLWIGFVGSIFDLLFLKKQFFLLFQILSFIGLFVFVSLACGFARLRLPVESFLIVLSFRFWLNFLGTNRTRE